MRNIFLPAYLMAASLLVAGCTTEAWYEGVKQSAQDECRRQPAGAAEQCLSRLNKQTYQEYEKARQENGVESH
jgi:hypothetical protein